MKHRITKKTHLHLRLVKGNRPAPAPPLDDGWPWRPPDPHARFDLPQEGLRLPSRQMRGANATGYEGPDWPPSPDARYDFTTDE